MMFSILVGIALVLGIVTMDLLVVASLFFIIYGLYKLLTSLDETVEETVEVLGSGGLVRKKVLSPRPPKPKPQTLPNKKSKKKKV